LPQLPILEGVVAQASIPKSTLNSGNVSLPLTNAFVDVYHKTFTPSINTAQKSLLFDTVLRFGIVSGPISFPLYAGTTRDISHNELSPVQIINFFTDLLTKAGIPIPAGVFDFLAPAFNNPLTDIAGDVVGTIGEYTGLEWDFGLRIKTHNVTAVLLGSPDSDSSQVAVALRVHLPELGAFVKLKYKVPRIGIPPWESKELPPKGFTADVLPLDIDFVLSIGYRINSVTHSVEITDVKIYVITATGTVVDVIISVGSSLFEAMTGISEIRKSVVQALSKLFEIALPGNLNLDLARIDFDASGNMKIAVEARQTDWNAL